jgi:hypothetical protein
MPPGLHSGFRAWLAAQDASTKAAVETAWEATATDGSIVHSHRHAEYARATLLLARCVAEHGFKP